MNAGETQRDTEEKVVKVMETDGMLPHRRLINDSPEFQINNLSASHPSPSVFTRQHRTTTAINSRALNHHSGGAFVGLPFIRQLGFARKVDPSVLWTNVLTAARRRILNHHYCLFAMSVP